MPATALCAMCWINNFRDRRRGRDRQRALITKKGAVLSWTIMSLPNSTTAFGRTHLQAQPIP